MALVSLKPASVAFVQTLIEERDINLNLEELSLSEKSPIVGKELRESRIREKFGVLVLAIKRGEESIINPEPVEKLMAGDLLIVCGTAENLTSLEKVAAGE
ncbi:MAG: TrkA C-terminal domain-containing protein [Pelotomaculum sp.]|uniref:Kef-type K+ transport systems, predicted NAD-binding component n=1 Tax=Pelotomaculum thermopropionicum (strain DSM 13744 / JCM 10971 / SI) TaxID=370438 RepID=A5D2A0_PELTS|nr:TrkA C-terminal domain-containing protein [Pelotomaculum sp.]BAF59643.1 kef-type K+ transport systems, predicted NAD-binding component [Pelotomaculum thermopropionicum SI]